MASYIQELGFEVVGMAEDGKEAVKLADELKPDFITMDLEMPHMKGDEASKNILENSPDAKIILITSIVDKKELVNASKIGVKKILKKPITQNIFANALAEIQR